MARFRETVTPLMRSCLQCQTKRRDVKSRLKRSDTIMQRIRQSVPNRQTGD